MRRAIAVLIAILVATGMAVVVGGHPALAATTACGSRCDDQDPSTYVVWRDIHNPENYITCADDAKGYGQLTGFPARKTIPESGDVVELRYSPYCQTAWARYSGNTFGCNCVADLYLEVYTTASGGSPRLTVRDGSGYSTQFWSNMANDAGLYARACLTEYWEYEVDPSNKTTVCTSRY